MSNERSEVTGEIYKFSERGAGSNDNYGIALTYTRLRAVSRGLSGGREEAGDALSRRLDEYVGNRT